ncbi:MAG: 30S ribosomal protein S3 [Lawsonibacter sp.]|nr:30S ribosomal protein S3 [Lawsonibacter sp.]
MGQKVNPHGLRVGVIKDWDSRWYARDDKVGDLLVEDKKIRDYLKKILYGAGVPKIEIERDNAKTRIYLHCARPGVVIGKGGEEIKKIEAQLVKMTGKSIDLKIVEVRDSDINAQLVAENIAQQLEKRIGFRRAMKNSMGRAMRAGAKGIKVSCGGRLGGAEIARTEHYHDGTIPLQTLRADIDYGFAEAATTYGRIGVKVWIYKGEVLTQALRTTPRTLDTSKPYQDHRDRPRRDRREGGFNRDRQSGGFNNNRGPRPAGPGGFNNNRGPRPAGPGGFNNNGGPRPAGPGGFNNNGGPRPAGPANTAKEGGAQ